MFATLKQYKDSSESIKLEIVKSAPNDPKELKESDMKKYPAYVPNFQIF